MEITNNNTHTHTHTRLTALFPGLPWWAGTRKVKPIWILLKQETVSGSDISWAICKQSAHRSRQITTPAPHHSVFYRPDALPAAQPTASKHLPTITMTTNYEAAPKQSTCGSQVSYQGKPARKQLRNLSKTPIISYHSCHLTFSIHYKNPASSVSKANCSRHCQLSKQPKTISLAAVT